MFLVAKDIKQNTSKGNIQINLPPFLPYRSAVYDLLDAWILPDELVVWQVWLVDLLFHSCPVVLVCVLVDERDAVVYELVQVPDRLVVHQVLF